MSRTMLNGKQGTVMFVVKPLMENADLRAFLSPAAANDYAETGVFQDCGCEADEIEVARLDALAERELGP
jgi:hypothetical protein